eukprot:CAMPEP_0203718538 /NCGR_PEP_ID=MMETSP0092-20131115/2809_1 /ASSEMBLY_ACC=CAM_ASM_001090 /TAXON_ID=426623 /ORGANISM="Chaetoceros affinis, Strain CCMP159" /LENGTH=35 /DNA_ID= /DNA_START= /DNA_END= /DNA_ORIENTATION=
MRMSFSSSKASHHSSISNEDDESENTMEESESGFG